MKKALAILLLGVLILTPVFVMTKAAEAHDVSHCFDDRETCRERVFGMDIGVIRMTWLLTVCDLALHKCMLNM